jgi:hypothetical protein
MFSSSQKEKSSMVPYGPRMVPGTIVFMVPTAPLYGGREPYNLGSPDFCLCFPKIGNHSNHHTSHAILTR